MDSHRVAIERELARLMSRIWAAERSLDDMYRQASEYQDILRASSTSPIARLPVEVLNLIFKEAAASPLGADAAQPKDDDVPQWSSPRPELLLSHVSRHWRAVALSTPALWTTIRLYVNQSIDLLDLYFARACGLPLDIGFRQSFMCGVYPQVAYAAEYTRISRSILTHISVCRRLEIRTNIPIPDLLESLGRMQAPLLQEIDLHHPRNNEFELTFPSSSFPKLKHLEIGEMLHLSPRMYNNAVTSLILSGMPGFALPPQAFCDMLCGLPSLSHLACLDEAVDFSRLHPTKAINVPSLRSMLLKPGPDVSRFYLISLLEMLVTPQLNILTLDFSKVTSSREIQLLLRHLKRGAPHFLSVRHMILNSPFDAFDIASALVHAAPHIESLTLSRYSANSILTFLTHDTRRDAFPKLQELSLDDPHFDWDVLLAFLRNRRNFGVPLHWLGCGGFRSRNETTLNGPFRKLLDACLDHDV
ncbi:hypothetical protein F5I97DRAFT_759309 [Phlebopus sp. FC_14]|nr:hypothetical protein F5I97DRAFT_759309 [Phlebopus sp. FC_14]